MAFVREASKRSGMDSLTYTNGWEPLPYTARAMNISVSACGLKNCINSFHVFCSHNTEKIVYFLLLDRKLRRPASEEADEVDIRTRVATRKSPNGI